MPQTGTGIVDGDPAEVVAKALHVSTIIM